MDSSRPVVANEVVTESAAAQMQHHAVAMGDTSQMGNQYQSYGMVCLFLQRRGTR